MPSTACATQTIHEKNHSDSNNKLSSPITTTTIHSPLNSDQTMITNVPQQDPISFIPTTKSITHSLKELSELSQTINVMDPSINHPPPSSIIIHNETIIHNEYKYYSEKNSTCEKAIQTMSIDNNNTTSSSIITSTADMQSKELNYTTINNDNGNNNDQILHQVVEEYNDIEKKDEKKEGEGEECNNDDIEKEDQQQQQSQSIKSKKKRQSAKPLYVNTNDKINGSRRSMTLSTTPRLWSPFRRSSSVSLRSNGRTDLLPNQFDDHDHTFEISDTISKKSIKKVRRRKHYADTDDEEDHIVIGTKVAEGHRNYQLM